MVDAPRPPETVSLAAPADALRPTARTSTAHRTDGPVAFLGRELALLRTSAAQLLERAKHPTPDDFDLALTALQVATEELRVADEELQAQRAQLDGLRADRRDPVSRLERLWAELPVACLHTDPGGVVRSANTAAADLLGVPLPSLVGKPLPLYVHVDDRARLRSALGAITDDEAPVRVAVRLAPRGLTAHPALLVGIPEQSGDGEVTRWVLVPGTDEGAPPGAVASTAWSRAGRSDDLRSAQAEVGARFADLCRAGDTRDLLHRAADAVCALAPPGAGVIVTLGHPDRPEEFVTDSVYAQQVAAVLLEAGDGPAGHAYANGVPMLVDDLSAAAATAPVARWAQRRGVPLAGVIAVPLTDGPGDAVGVILVGAPETGQCDEDLLQAVRLVATATGALLAQGREEGALRELTEQLQQALVSRPVIDQAKGILMAERGCTPDEAFELLRSTSRRRQTKVRHLAQLLVEGHPLPE